jgi:molybdopterin synthase sulfur carrier subunit
MSKVTVLYFARLSETLNCREEQLELPAQPLTAEQLRSSLVERGGAWGALSQASLRVAVNQEIVGWNTPISAGDEIAFFPPVTGG